MANKNVYTAVEITDHHLKILQGARQGDFLQVSRCAIRPLGAGREESAADFLAEFLPAKEVEMERLCAVIPRRHFVFRRLHLPSVQREELRRMIGLQIRGFTPYAREEVIFDWVAIKEEGGFTEALVMIVHKEVVERLMNIFSRARLRPSRFVPSSFGLLNWHLAQSHHQQVADGKTVLMVDADYGGLEIAFFRGNGLVLSRYLPGGPAERLAEREHLFKEFRICLDDFLKENPGAELQEIIITAGNRAEGLAALVGEALAVPTVVQNSFSALSYVDGFDYSLLRNYGEVSVMSAVGCLCEPKVRWPNLFSEEAVVQKRQKTRRARVNRLVSAAGTCCLLLAALAAAQIWSDRRYLGQLQQNNQKLERELQQLTQVNDAIRALPAVSGRGALVADLFKELYAVVPDELALRSVDLDSDGALVIQGEADSGSRVNELQQRLLSSGRLTDVSLQYATQRRRPSGEYTEFKITCRLSGRKGGADEPI